MVKVKFEQIDGSVQEVDAAAGASLMEGAVYGGVDGIDADCGGELACATCHVILPEPWRDRVPGPTEDEAEMLSFAVGTTEGSRLSCQIRIDASLDGMTVRVPATQR